MHYGEYKNTYIDTNECTSRGACSIAPNIASLQELIMYFIKQTAHYIIKLENSGAVNKSIKYNIINDISALVSINEFSEEQLFTLAVKNYYLLKDTKKAYFELCSNMNIACVELKNKVEFDSSTTLSKAISIGEKIFLQNYTRYTISQKNLTEILYTVIKSTCINLIKLNDFDEFDEEMYQQILHSLDLFNHGKIQCQKIREEIKKLALSDYEARLKISEILINKFGGIEKVQVSHSTRKGKAILVSGNNFLDLKNLLERTKDENIDIYTHSNLMIVHALREFRNYKNLAGHYGDLSENSILDFATFPGSIFLTKNSRKNPEYLYRGRLFSNDYIIQKGVIEIIDNDYSELILSAKEAKGFSKGKIKPFTTLGYNEEELDKNFDEIITKLDNNEIKRLFIIGINIYSEVQKEYFQSLFSKLNKNEYAISFTSETSNKDNILTINTGNYMPLATGIINKLFSKHPITDERIYFFFTKCDVMTISNIITLNNYNAKNIYMSDCPPTIINPSVFKTFKKEYNIQTTTTAQKDLEKIRTK